MKGLNISIGVILVSFLLGLILLNDETDNEKLKEEFSVRLNTWFEKGQYYHYKGKHKLFYVHEILNSKSEENSNQPDEEPATILLLHGFPTSSYDYYQIWNQFIDTNQEVKLGAKYKSILTFDYLGYGFSDKPLEYEYSIFDMADMIDKLLLHLNIRSVYLIAHDVSDTVAQELLRRDYLNHQNHFKINKLVMLNGGIFYDIYKPSLSQDILRTKYLNNFFAKYCMKFFIFKHFFSKIFGTLKVPSESEMYDFYMEIKYSNGNLVLPLMISYLDERRQYNDIWLDALNETFLPMMFVYGPADPINPRSKFPQKLRQDIPKMKLKILSDLVGHYPQYEDPFTVFQLIKQFFIE